MTPRMRTISEAASELRKIDPGTAVTPYRIRQLVLAGEIPCVTAGNKRLVNMETLLRYLSGEFVSVPPRADYGTVRPIKG